MKIYHTSGTLGDTFIIICKLYAIAKREKILCRHHTRHESIRPIIREIYSLMPNIKVKFSEPDKSTLKIQGWFDPKSCKLELEKYGLKPEYYPKFELKDVVRFNLPKYYNVLQLESGIGNKRRLDSLTVQGILSDSEFPIVIIGKDSIAISIGRHEVVDLRGDTSIKEVISIIKNSKHFYGPQGLLSFIAVSQKTFSTIYLTSGSDVRAIYPRIEIVDQWRRYSIKKWAIK